MLNKIFLSILLSYTTVNAMEETASPREAQGVKRPLQAEKAGNNESSEPQRKRPRQDQSLSLMDWYVTKEKRAEIYNKYTEYLVASAPSSLLSKEEDRADNLTPELFIKALGIFIRENSDMEVECNLALTHRTLSNLIEMSIKHFRYPHDLRPIIPNTTWRVSHYLRRKIFDTCYPLDDLPDPLTDFEKNQDFDKLSKQCAELNHPAALLFAAAAYQTLNRDDKKHGLKFRDTLFKNIITGNPMALELAFFMHVDKIRFIQDSCDARGVLWDDGQKEEKQFYHLADQLVQKGFIDSFKDAACLNPGYDNVKIALRSVSLTYLEENSPLTALKLATVIAEDKDGESLNHLGRIHKRLGNYALAKSFFHEAFANTDDPFKQHKIQKHLKKLERKTQQGDSKEKEA